MTAVMASANRNLIGMEDVPNKQKIEAAFVHVKFMLGARMPACGSRHIVVSWKSQVPGGGDALHRRFTDDELTSREDDLVTL